MDAKMSKIKRVLWLIFGLNILVSGIKIILGYHTNTNSVLADGFHSLTDGTSNIIGLVGIHAAMAPVDREHPYGHKKFETMASLAIAALLSITVLTILHEAYERMINPVIPEVNLVSFAVMLITLGVNLLVVRYERKQGIALQSDVLISDSYHTGSDILVSLAVIATLIGVKLGWLWLDTVASLVIAALIAGAVWKIVKHAGAILCDRAVLDEERVVKLALEVEGVQGCHKVRSRGRSDDLQIDLHIQVNRDVTVAKAHDISHSVADLVRREIEGVGDVVVHVEPDHELSE